MKILEKISGFLFLMFFTVLALGVFISQTDFKIKMELPINDFAGFVVDCNENIYIGDNFYSIIQKYNKEGQFIESIRVKNTKGKFFRMVIDSKDNIIVNAQIDKNSTIYPYYNRDRSFIIYNNNKSEKLKDENNIFINSKKQRFENLGTLYYPVIWKLSETKQKIVEQNLFLKIFSLPTMTIIVVMALVMKLTEIILGKYRKYKTKI
jgi:hypothetical protein